jgi:hypothetical protein
MGRRRRSADPSGAGNLEGVESEHSDSPGFCDCAAGGTSALRFSVKASRLNIQIQFAYTSVHFFSSLRGGAHWPVGQ